MIKETLYGTVVALLLFAAGAIGMEQDAVADATWSSRDDEFRVSFTSRLQPIVINRIHSWVLHVETAGGEPVANADISVDGGMPEHDHGLPTAPRVTRYLGSGNYLVEGLRFHMNGYWELEYTITSGDVADTVVIPLTL